jgi:hypothetical protein
MLGNSWLDNIREKRSHARVGTLLVVVHEARITGHVGNHDCR